jgi:hypothetical protein
LSTPRNRPKTNLAAKNTIPATIAIGILTNAAERRFGP